MATYEDKIGGLSSMAPEDLESLEAEIVSAFEAADSADDLDAMSAAADALDSVRNQRASADVPADVEPVAASAEGNPFAKKDEDEEGSPKEEASESEDEADAEGDEKSPKKKNPFTASGDETKALEDAPSDEAITASTQAKEANVDVPEDRQPVPSTPAITITAGADIPGMSAGTAFTNERGVSEAFVSRIGTLRNLRGGDGEQLIVATVASAAPDARTLEPGDLEGNVRKINEVTGLRTSGGIVASGGYCAPLEVSYDIFGLGIADRPIRDSLAGFQAKRGGLRFVQPPVLSSLAGAVGIWNQATDADYTEGITNKALTSNVATLTTGTTHSFVVGQTVKVSIGDPVFDGTYVISAVTATTFSYNRTNANVVSVAVSPTGSATANKPYLKVQCSPEQTAVLDAVTLQLEFGNLMGRAFPELVSRNNELGMIQHARQADMSLLAKISALSTAVTSGLRLGMARDFLEAAGRGAAAYRARHRMGVEAPLRVLAPAWVKDAMREDLAWGLPGDNLEWADSVIEGFFRVRNINVTWHLDDGSSLTAAQASGALNAWPGSFKWNIFAEGTFLFLDGGTLDLGIVRDSGLVSTNDYRMFLESFEGLAKVGIESIEVTTTTAVTGKVAATGIPA